MALGPQAQMVLDFLHSLELMAVSPTTTPGDLRDRMNAAMLPVTVEVGAVEDQVITGPHGDIAVRIYRPASQGPKPIIVYFHGGGWVLGSLDTHDHTARMLADGVDAVVVSVDYHLAPEFRFPVAVEDSFFALQWVHDNAGAIGGDPERIVVGGDSAGGNLAAVVAQMSREHGPKICFQLLIYPVTDYEFTSASMVENAEGYFLTREMMEWFYNLYLNDPSDANDARVSPVRAADLSNLAPAFVMTAEHDPLRDQGNAYAAAMSAAGNVVEVRNYDGLFHGFFGLGAMIDAAQVSFDDAIAAVRAAVGTVGA